jgi:hypothetical protein
MGISKWTVHAQSGHFHVRPDTEFKRLWLGDDRTLRDYGITKANGPCHMNLVLRLRQGLADVARHVIDTHFEPSFLELHSV